MPHGSARTPNAICRVAGHLVRVWDGIRRRGAVLSSRKQERKFHLFQLEPLVIVRALTLLIFESHGAQQFVESPILRHDLTHTDLAPKLSHNVTLAFLKHRPPPHRFQKRQLDEPLELDAPHG